MAAKLYYQEDCNLSVLEGQTIAIIGYGSQGHAHALNLKESGCNVIIGLYEGSKSWAKAEAQGFEVFTAVRMEPIGEFYSKWKAIECMENGEIVIMSGGTGNPFFTTDTGSSLRGIEIEADVMLKGTRVDGIYTADPEKDPTATKFSDITYDEVLKRGLKVMDLTATCMCKENNLPIVVFDMDTVGNLKKVISGEEIGTVVHN